MPSSIPLNHTSKPHLRMRGTGKTRFHEAIENIYSSDRIEWLEVEGCPYNRRARDGSHPLLAAIIRVVADLKQPKETLGKMPTWWNEVYKDDTKEDWELKQTKQDEKTLSESRLVFEKCLQNVNWSDWTSEDIESVLGAIPLTDIKEDERGLVLDHILDAGLPIARLKYNGTPTTPAMWSVLKTPYSCSLPAWLNRDIALDPPGNRHPGLLAALLFNWNSLPSSFKLNIQHHLQKAFDLGARMDLPVAPSQWADDRHKKDNYLFRRDDSYLKINSALGQAQALQEPDLVAAISKHANVSDDDRIDIIKVLMKQTGEAWGKRWEEKTDILRQKHFEQLWKLLQEPVLNQEKWRNASKDLLSIYFSDLWTKISIRHEPRIVELLDLMEKMGVDMNIDLSSGFASWEQPAANMAWSMTLPEAILAMDVNAGALSKCHGINLQKFANEMAIGFARCALLDRWGQSTGNEKTIRMTQHALSMEMLDQGCGSKMEEILFSPSTSGLSVTHLKSLVVAMKKSDWRASSQTWDLLVDRIGKSENNDSAEVIDMLTQVAATHGAIPNCKSLFLAPCTEGGSTKDKRALFSGYRETCDWGPADIRKAHLLIVQRAIPLLNVNDAAWSSHNKSPLCLVAQYMQSNSDPEVLAHFDQIARLLLHAGAHPNKEFNGQTQEMVPGWTEDIDPSNSFHGTWSRWGEKELERDTPVAAAPFRMRRI